MSAPGTADIVFADPVHQEIWATLRAVNDAWTQGHPDDLADYFHAWMIAITPVDRLRRDGAAACVAGWKSFADAARIYRWQEFDPLIRVYDDAAVASYYYEIDFAMGGKRTVQSGRDLFFLVRDNGRWQVVADQFSPYP